MIMIPETRSSPHSAVEKPRNDPPQQEETEGILRENIFREDEETFQKPYLCLCEHIHYDN